MLVWFTLDLRDRPPSAGDPERWRPPSQRIWQVAAPALAFAVAVGVLDTLSAGPGRGAATGVGFGLVVLLLTRRRLEKHVETGAGQVSPVEVGVFALVLVGLLAGFGYGLMFGAIAGLSCRVTRDIALRRQPSGRARPSARGAAAGVLLGGIALLGAVFDHIAAGWLLLIGLTGGTAGAFAFGVESRDPERLPTASPYGLYRRDRAASIVITVAVAVALGLAVGARAMAIGGSARIGLFAALATLLTYGITAGLMISMAAARYLAFTVSRVRLYYRGHLPWALMPFLDDAHRNRLVLRSAGAAYQFRHQNLKERIADDGPALGEHPAPTAP